MSGMFSRDAFSRITNLTGMDFQASRFMPILMVSCGRRALRVAAEKS
jgi:hypothetical protein